MTRTITLTILALAAALYGYAGEARKKPTPPEERKRLLSLLEELSACEGDRDIDAQAEALGLHVQSALLCKKLGLSSLAIAHKKKAEQLIKDKPVLVGAWPAMDESDQKIMESIKTKEAADPTFEDFQKAITEREWQTVRKILQEDPGMFYGKDKDGCTVVHHAALAGREDILKLALKKLKRLDTPDLKGRKPLHYAAMSDHVEAVELLLTKESDVILADDAGKTPLHFVKNREVASYLLLKGADVMARDNKGNTPLHCASDLGSRDVVELLLWKKADVKARNAEGETPLHSAVGFPRKGTIEALLKHGAEINAPDKEGQTPLHRAVMMLDKETARLLVKEGADLNAKDKLGLTPGAYAQKLKQMGLFDVLKGGKSDK
jgi:ankyrin repeat protein